MAKKARKPAKKKKRPVSEKLPPAPRKPDPPQEDPLRDTGEEVTKRPVHGRRGRAKKTEILYRRQQVAMFYFRGWPINQIAEKCGVSKPTVFKDMEFLRGEWKKHYLEDFNRRLIEDLARLDRLYDEVWRAWERSQEDAEIEKVTDGGESPKVEKTRKGQAGDPRFSGQLLDIVKTRLEFLKELHGENDPQGKGGGRYAEGYELAFITIESREQVSEVMTLDAFRHQFAGFSDPSDEPLTIDGAMQTDGGNGQQHQEGNGNGKAEP